MGLDRVNVTIGGEAGQGLVTVGELLAKSLARCGYEVLVTQSYMSRVRGGYNTYSVNASTAAFQAPFPDTDILVALNGEVGNEQVQEQPGARLVVLDASFPATGEGFLRVPFSELAESRYQNITALGVVGSILGLDKAVLTGAVHSAFGKKKPEMAQKNMSALEKAYSWASDQKLAGYCLNAATGLPGRLFMNGNDAIALGAVSAGLKFCSFYPMTPATSISLRIAGWAGRLGLVVEQAEDEIAAINMALGASYAGAPSMVATSGGGFALMTEGVSLAGMMETPLVIALAQRPGPATGLPTRTEQGDLEMALYAGHGEFPRAIFAPGSVEECFHLTRRAFRLAEDYQSPVFVLTDQYLADCIQTIAPFDLESCPLIQLKCDAEGVEAPYKRYRFVENGVSPRLLPGVTEHLVIADSDEHCEYGHLTEDLTLRVKMVEKRLKKLEGIVTEILPPAYVGEAHPELLMVTWGSSKGAVLEAAQELGNDGRSVAVLSFSQVWPLNSEDIMEHLKRAKRVVSVEGNATGQFARLIRGETGFLMDACILRYDGLPITPQYILERLSWA